MAVSAFEIIARRQAAPLVLNLLLASTCVPFLQAWKAANGTALRPALIWAMLAATLLLGASLLAIHEPPSSGRPGAARLTYLAILCLLAAFGSVLNARVPGSRVWAGLMAVLVLVFLIPWLEGPLGMHRRFGLAPFRLDSPWNLFYGFLVAVGVTNYLPTRFALAAVGFGATFLLEYLALAHWDWPPGRRAIFWSWIGWTFVLSVWTARWRADYRPTAVVPFERLWFWFRDAWGVVWALRTLERFNRTAELKGWPIRLTWFGVCATGVHEGGHTVAVPAEAISDFRALVRRFATGERLESAMQGRSNL
jgi:hypothetical protein